MINPQTARLCITLAGTLLLAGCLPSRPSGDPATPDASPLPKVEIYGLLSQREGGYTFSRFALNSPGDGPAEAWVDLKTLQPVFPTDTRECSLGMVDLIEKQLDRPATTARALCDVHGPLFRDGEVDIGDVAKNTVGNLVTQISGIGVSGYFTTHFAPSAYRDALQQATRTFDFARLTTRSRRLLGQYRQSLAALEDQFSAAREQFKAQTRLSVEDATKSFPLAAKALKKDLEVRLSHAEPEITPALVFDNTDHLERQLQLRVVEFEKSFTLTLNCPLPEGFEVNVRGCDGRYDAGELTSRDWQPHIHYQIVAKEAVRFIPRFPEFGDQTLRISSGPGGTIRVRNQSSEPVVFESVSLSLNDDIATQFILGQQLPGQSAGTLPPLQSFENYEPQMAFAAIDADTLATTAAFGLEVTYTERATGIKKTVNGMFQRPYGELLQQSY